MKRATSFSRVTARMHRSVHQHIITCYKTPSDLPRNQSNQSGAEETRPPSSGTPVPVLRSVPASKTSTPGCPGALPKKHKCAQDTHPLQQKLANWAHPLPTRQPQTARARTSPITQHKHKHNREARSQQTCKQTVDASKQWRACSTCTNIADHAAQAQP